jgi:hypothetical protein
MNSNQISETRKFTLTPEQWTKLEGDIKGFRSTIHKQGITSRLKRKGNDFWIEIVGVKRNVDQALVMFDGILMNKAPQNAEQQKQRDELEESMKKWQEQHGVGVAGASPGQGFTITQRKP